MDQNKKNLHSFLNNFAFYRQFTNSHFNCSINQPVSLLRSLTYFSSMRQGQSEEKEVFGAQQKQKQ